MQTPDDTPSSRRRPAKAQPARASEEPANKAGRAAGKAAKAPGRVKAATAPGGAVKAGKAAAKAHAAKAPNGAKAPKGVKAAKVPNGTKATKGPQARSQAGRTPVRRASASQNAVTAGPPGRPAEPAQGRRPEGPEVVNTPIGRATRAGRLALTVRRLRRATAVLLVLGVCGFLIDGASRPANPRLVPASDPTAGKGSPPFGTATLSVNGRPGAAACVLEAVTRQQQTFGLMDRTSVAPYAGMAFVFASPSTDRFWMKQTAMALSVAWFDQGGTFEAEASMPPCHATTCPTYGPGRPYSLAIEAPAGRLGPLGIGPGSVVQVGGPCA